MKLAIVAAVGLAVAGCATVTRGTTNQVTVSSEPTGAEAVSSSGLFCTATPCTWEVSRKTEFAVTFKKPGYRTEQVQVGTKLAGSGAAGFAGNVLIGGVVGMGVDAATGATLEHFPNPVFVTLQPVAAPKPVRVARPRKVAPVKAPAPPAASAPPQS
ncbi:MAG: translation initiation factor 2 [Hyphomicrobiales bacterium]|nr:translation initiation factor 2 [Hyphomicrobiales bacterium]